MSADKRLTQISSHLTELPSIPQIAGDSVGKRLVGKVAIITGCNSTLGIGRATAHQYAHNGLKALYICDYDSSNLESLQAEIEAANPGVKVHARTFDASSEEVVQAVCEEAVATYGRLDIFYANAGISGSALTLVTDIAVDQFMWTLKTNVVSVFLAVKHASKAMMKTSAEKPHSGGSIIATASTAGIRSGAGATDYSASKAAVISIMQTSAFQLAGSNIRCNAICPGLIETGMTALLWEAARARGSVGKIGQINPLRRGGVADEIARVALFLGSDEYAFLVSNGVVRVKKANAVSRSSYVNAQFWAVDGGLSGSHPTVRGKFA